MSMRIRYSLTVLKWNYKNLTAWTWGETGNFVLIKSFIYLFIFYQWNPLIAHSVSLFSLRGWSHYVTFVADNVSVLELFAASPLFLSDVRRKQLWFGPLIFSLFLPDYTWMYSSKGENCKPCFSLHIPSVVFGLMSFKNSFFLFF